MPDPDSAPVPVPRSGSPDCAPTTTRRRWVAAGALLAAGITLGAVLRSDVVRAVGRFVPRSEASWRETVREDAVSLLAVINPDPRLPEDLASAPEFVEAWRARRGAYSPERLADLAARLEAYLVFLEAEHEDAAEIYRSGIRPDVGTSEASRAAREGVRSAYGPFAETLLRQGDDLREQAYRASPKTAGYDPYLPDYAEQARVLREWLPRARARVVELTGVTRP